MSTGVSSASPTTLTLGPRTELAQAICAAANIEQPRSAVIRERRRVPAVVMADRLGCARQRGLARGRVCTRARGLLGLKGVLADGLQELVVIEREQLEQA